MDSTYSSEKIRENIRKGYPRCKSFIDPKGAHKRAISKTIKRPGWKMVYKGALLSSD